MKNLTKECIVFPNIEGTGIFVIRKTEAEARKALEKYFLKRIEELSKEILQLKKINKISK